MRVRVLNFNVMDQDGDIFSEESVTKSQKVLPLRINFKSGVIRMISAQVDKKGVLASIPESFKGSGLYPAIGFKKDGDKIEIFEVSLCSQPNADPSIKPI